MELNKIYQGDVIATLKTWPDEFVQCVVTSPPYWGLRDYGVDGQLGLEKTPEEYVAKMAEVFREVRRVLKKDGVLFLNLGDSYGNPSAGRNDGNHRADGRPGGMSYKATGTAKFTGNTVKPKDLVGIPWMIAFALRSDGWYLRQDIIWAKPNPMPESVTDRCTKSHEYIFMMTKSARYFYDAAAIKEAGSEPPQVRPASRMGVKALDGLKNASPNMDRILDGTRNKRSVWAVPTHPYAEAHFATFPEDLIIPCIKAGSREGDVVLDPFMGAGTTGLVALKLGRKYIGTELNPAYIQIAEDRIRNGFGLFQKVS